MRALDCFAHLGLQRVSTENVLSRDSPGEKLPGYRNTLVPCVNGAVGVARETDALDLPERFLTD